VLKPEFGPHIPGSIRALGAKPDFGTRSGGLRDPDWVPKPGLSGKRSADQLRSGPKSGSSILASLWVFAVDVRSVVQDGGARAGGTACVSDMGAGEATLLLLDNGSPRSLRAKAVV